MTTLPKDMIGIKMEPIWENEYYEINFEDFSDEELIDLRNWINKYLSFRLIIEVIGDE